MKKVIVTVISALIVAIVLGLFNFNSRMINLEAKVPTGCDSRLTALEVEVPAIKETHKTTKKSIEDNLTHIRSRVDNIYIILTKHK